MLVKVIGRVGERRRSGPSLPGLMGRELVEECVLSCWSLGSSAGVTSAISASSASMIGEIGAQVVLPCREVHVGETDLDFAADLLRPTDLEGSKSSSSSGSASSKVAETSANVPSLPVLRSARSSRSVSRWISCSLCSVRRNACNRTFQALEEIDRHQRPEALLAVGLPSLPRPPSTSVSYISSYFGMPAREDVAQRGIDAKLQHRSCVEDLVEADDIRAGLSAGSGRRAAFGAAGKRADLLHVVEGLDVPARAGDGDRVEQFEEIEVERVQDRLRRCAPPAEASTRLERGLRTAEDLLDVLVEFELCR